MGISRQGVLSYEERDMRQNLKDEDHEWKQPVTLSPSICLT